MKYFTAHVTITTFRIKSIHFNKKITQLTIKKNVKFVFVVSRLRVFAFLSGFFHFFYLG